MTCASACLAVPRGKKPERVLTEKLRRCDARHCARLAVVLQICLGDCDAEGCCASARRGTLKWPPSARTISVSGSSIASRSMRYLRMSRADLKIVASDTDKAAIEKAVEALNGT
jgi:hypothetical protein